MQTKHGKERIVAVKLPEDVYRELEQRARRLGYGLVSSYLLDLIYRELGYAERGEEIRRIVEEELEKRGGATDLDRALARLEKKLQDMVNPWTSKIDSVSQRLAELYEKVDRLEEELRNVKEKLEEAGARRAEHAVAPPSGYQQRLPVRRAAGERPARRGAMERLHEQGVVFEHEMHWMRNRDAFFEKLKREGAVVLEIGGERAAVDPEFWRRFQKKLSELFSPSEEEARRALSPAEYRLFQKLKENGLIYFDSSEGRWKLIEE